MKTPARLAVGMLAASGLLLTGCASRNPYEQSAPSSNRTATYGGLGALAGAADASAPRCAVKRLGCTSVMGSMERL